MTVGRIPSVEGGIQPTIVDAKGDLIAAVAADSLNRLAVGSNDQVLVADSAASTGLAWKSYGAQFVAGKNKIINGDFSINQRGFTSTTTTQTYGFDRWTFLSAGDGSTTYSAQTFTPGTAPVAGYEATNFARLVSAGQTTSNSQSYLIQRIENVRTLANQTATVSFWARAASGTPKVSIEFGQNFGSGGSATAYTNGGTVTLSTSWERYSATVLISSISGKTIGDSSNRLFLTLYTSAGSDVTRANSIGIQNNTIDFWGVQVEAGSVATPFTTATGTIQGELAACQRYYFRFANSAATANYGLGYAYNTTSAAIQLRTPVTMRITPSTLDYSTIRLTIVGTADYAITGLAIDAGTSGPDVSVVLATGASGLTQYRPYSIGNASSTAGYIGLSAEL